ncbi:hypothetical protein EVAR_54588_1 [Eumeta japonica]|uniref:Uncharacterized protein n=1 Tax=Eumeta variegata TaxID=151549 RepID=A0A4C1YQE3_EUMVA|nr:hypothetical protein EVAR_54588_1 [Eumeta japonica]
MISEPWKPYFYDTGASWESVFSTVRQEGVVGSAFVGMAAAAAGAAGFTGRVPGEAEIDGFGFLPDRLTKPGPYVQTVATGGTTTLVLR